MAKKKPPDLTIVLDFGGSATKGIFIDKQMVEWPLYMEPEVISIPKSAVEIHERMKLGSSEPSDSAWVSIDDACYAVGYLASSKFNANAGLSSLKYERAFPKTLAAVWVASQKLKLKSKFDAAIAILLPASEYESSKNLHEMIADGLDKFETPTGILNVTLTNYDCKPEGGGIYIMHRARQGDAAKRRTIAVVMIGYRNASVLLSERGQVNKKVTCNLGFIRLVELVEGRVTALPSTARLAAAIACAGSKVDPKPLSPLAASSVPESREEEVQRLVSAVQSCRTEYISSLTSWLREVLPMQIGLDEVVFCGGTAEYLKSELEQYFSYTDINWNADIELPENLLDTDLGSRLCDAYGMYVYFRSIVAQSVVRAVPA